MGLTSASDVGFKHRLQVSLRKDVPQLERLRKGLNPQMRCHLRGDECVLQHENQESGLPTQGSCTNAFLPVFSVLQSPLRESLGFHQAIRRRSARRLAGGWHSRNLWLRGVFV